MGGAIILPWWFLPLILSIWFSVVVGVAATVGAFRGARRPRSAGGWARGARRGALLGAALAIVLPFVGMTLLLLDNLLTAGIVLLLLVTFFVAWRLRRGRPAA